MRRFIVLIIFSFRAPLCEGKMLRRNSLDYLNLVLGSQTLHKVFPTTSFLMDSIQRKGQGNESSLRMLCSTYNHGHEFGKD